MNYSKGSDNMNKKYGFTLIELLAVIVILAIIALIAVPIILNIIDKAKISSSEISNEFYLDAVEQAIAKENLSREFNPTTCKIKSNGNLSCDVGELVVEVDRKKPCGGNIKFKDGKIEEKNIEYTCEPIPEPKSFKDDDWKTIVANVKEGNTEVYKVGDEKTIELTGDVSGKYKVRIANKETPEECSNPEFSETACGFVVEFVDIIVEHAMNTQSTSAGGWQDSEMRKYVNNEIYNALPQEIKDGIISTRVISGHEKGVTENYKTQDNLYLLSTKEISGTASSNDTVTETNQLDYYKNHNSSAIKRYNNAATFWWLRSAHSYVTGSFFSVSTSGGLSVYSANNALIGVAPAFRIG